MSGLVAGEGQISPQLNASLVGRGGGGLTFMHMQDIPKPGSARQVAGTTQMSAQLHKWALACLWPTAGKEDTTKSKQKRAKKIALLTNDSTSSGDSNTLSLVTSDI